MLKKFILFTIFILTTPLFVNAEDNLLGVTQVNKYKFTLEQVFTPNQAKNYSLQHNLFLRCYDRKTNKKIDEILLNYEGYGGLVFQGSIPLKVHSFSNVLYFSFDVIYGGDGDHTEPRLYIIKFDNEKFLKLFNLNMGGLAYKKANVITGITTIMLNPNCDGPEAADSKDIFSIPLKIKFYPNSVTINCLLDKREKASLLKEFNQRKALLFSQEYNQKDENLKKWVLAREEEINYYLNLR